MDVAKCCNFFEIWHIRPNTLRSHASSGVLIMPAVTVCYLLPVYDNCFHQCSCLVSPGSWIHVFCSGGYTCSSMCKYSQLIIKVIYLYSGTLFEIPTRRGAITLGKATWQCKSKHNSTLYWFLPVTRGRPSWKATFLMQKGLPHKRGSTVYVLIFLKKNVVGEIDKDEHVLMLCLFICCIWSVLFRYFIFTSHDVSWSDWLNIITLTFHKPNQLQQIDQISENNASNF